MASRVVIVPGNGCGEIEECNWYAWARDEINKVNDNLVNISNSILLLGQIINKYQLIVLFFQKEEDEGLYFFKYFFQDGRQAFKLKMATNFSVQNDRQLFIYSYPTNKLSQNIHFMYFVKPFLPPWLNPIVYACSFQLHFHFNKTQMNTIVPDLKVVVTNMICTELTNRTIFIF